MCTIFQQGQYIINSGDLRLAQYYYLLPAQFLTVCNVSHMIMTWVRNKHIQNNFGLDNANV